MFMKGGVRKARKLIAEIDRYFCFFIYRMQERAGEGEQRWLGSWRKLHWRIQMFSWPLLGCIEWGGPSYGLD